MSTITICSAGIIASLLVIVLRKNNTEYSIILTVCASAVMVIYISGAIVESFGDMRDIFDQSGLNGNYIPLMLKCVGICFLTEFTCDTCKDAGQASLAGIVLFGGRISVLVLALPLFSELLAIVMELSGG